MRLAENKTKSKTKLNKTTDEKKIYNSINSTKKTQINNVNRKTHIHTRTHIHTHARVHTNKTKVSKANKESIKQTVHKKHTHTIRQERKQKSTK